MEGGKKMQVVLSDIINPLKEDELTFLSFLKLLSVTYRYDFKQILMLYNQGFTACADLVGYEYFQAQKWRNVKPNLDDRYIVELCGQTVYLFSSGRVALRHRHKLEESSRRYMDVMARKYIELFKRYTGLVVTTDCSQKTYSIVNGELLINTKGDIQKYMIEAAIEYKTNGAKSLFIKDVVHYIYFGGDKLSDFSIISNLSPKELYNLLEEAFTLYQEIVYMFKEKYFTLTEIAVLNSCYECEISLDSLINTLQSNPYAELVLLNKLRGLRDETIIKLIQNIKAGKLNHYPLYHIE